MSDTRLVDAHIGVEDLRRIADEQFGDMVKAVVDVEQRVMAIGADLHADEEALLLDRGSAQGNLWGVNLYPGRFGHEDFVEFDSMINVRPSIGNRSRSVEDPALRALIATIVADLVGGDPHA